MQIVTKRVYEKASESDGRRVLVDRLWPRGLSKEKVLVDQWAKEVSPSNELRQWYAHDPEKWEEFKKRYFAELDSNPNAVTSFLNEIGEGTVTFLYSSKEPELNNATALKEYVEIRKG